MTYAQPEPREAAPLIFLGLNECKNILQPFLLLQGRLG